MSQPLKRKSRGDPKRKRDDDDVGASDPPPTKKGSTEDPIQLEEEDPAELGPTRAPSPDLPMVQTGGDGARGLTRLRRGPKPTTVPPAAPVATIPAGAHEARAPPPPPKDQSRSKGNEVSSVGSDVIWKSGQSLESFVEEIQKEARKEVPALLTQAKDPKYFRHWVKQLVKVSLQSHPVCILLLFLFRAFLCAPYRSLLNCPVGVHGGFGRHGECPERGSGGEIARSSSKDFGGGRQSSEA